jgi:predicted nucleotide-binding protein
MGRKTAQSEPQSASLSVEAMRAALPKIARREAELRGFDLSTLTGDGGRDGPKMDQLLNKYNQTLLDTFGVNTIEYNRYVMGSLWSSDEPLVMDFYGGSRGPDPDRAKRAYGNGINEAIAHLETIKTLFEEALGDIPHASGASGTTVVSTRSRPVGKKVFIVHGHDEAAKEMLARFVAQLGLEPVILHEQANRGRTIIEKLEGHLEMDFAVVLLTPDDVGCAADAAASPRPRARQNVVLELGLFLGALGRRNVCALHKGDLELPSDFDGVIYVPMDAGGGWRLLLAREIKDAGLAVDLNKAL